MANKPRSTTPEAEKVIWVLPADLSGQELQTTLDLMDSEHFRKTYLLRSFAFEHYNRPRILDSRLSQSVVRRCEPS